jgi:acyl carrier protein
MERAVATALSTVAPEADLSTLDPKQGLREQLDLDSMDFLNFIVGLHHALQIEVPERDYAKLATLESCVTYLLAALHQRNP